MEINQKLSTLEMKTRLSTLWIFTLLNVIFRDIHEFVRPGFLEELMTGVQVTEQDVLSCAMAENLQPMEKSTSVSHSVN